MANADFVKNVGFDYAAELGDIERRRAMAQALQQQSMQPLEAPPTPAGGFAVPISPWQGIAKLAQGAAGGYGQYKATEMQKELAKQIQQNEAEDFKRIGDIQRGQQIQPTQTGSRELPLAGGGSGVFQGPAEGAQAMPAETTQGRQLGMGDLAGIKSPQVRALVQALMMKQMEEQNKSHVVGPSATLVRPGMPNFTAPDRPMPLHFGNTGNALQGMNPMTGAPVGQPLPISMGPAQQAQHDENQGWGEPYELGGAMVRKNAITGKVEQVVARPPQMHVNSPPAVTTARVQDPNNPNQQLEVDARTYRGGSLGSPGVIGVSGKQGDLVKQEQKLSVALPQARLRVQTMEQNIDKLDGALRELHDDPGLSNITGTLMGRTPNLTNKATGAQAKLDSLKAQIFVSALQSMREASKTGGAVGNVSDREGDKLERTLSALDQAQGTPSFKEQIKKAREQLKTSRALIRNAFEEQYSGIPEFQGTSGNRTGATADFGAPPPGAVRPR